MSDQQDISQPRQGDEYIRLGRLLKKSRSKEQSEIVEGILNSEISVLEKINKIKNYDAQNEHVKEPAAPPVKAESQEKIPTPKLEPIVESSARPDKKHIQELIRQNRITTAKVANKNVELVKKRVFRLPYLFFIFGEFRKIKQFARDTRTIVARFFPPRVRVDANLQHQLLSIIKKDATDLFPYLEKVLAIAWQVLEKDQYNLIVKLQDLCALLSRTRFNTWDLNTPHVLDNLLSIERQFLALYTHKEYPEMIIKSMDIMMKKSGYESEIMDKINTLIRRIILPEETRPSLYYFILACNMVKNRRYLTLKDLLNSNAQSVINNFQFDCNQTVNVQIGQFIKQKSEMLEHFAREKYEIEKVHHFLIRFINEDEDGGYDFRILSAFYSVLSDTERYHFSADLSKLEKFIPRFIGGYLESFEIFLTHSTKIEGFGSLRIFDPEYAGYEIARLHSFLEKFYKELFNCPQMSLTRFLSLKKKKEGKGASGSELVLVRIIEEMGEIIVELGKKLSEILVQYRHPDLVPTDVIYKPLEPSLIMLKNTLIPFWDARIIADQIVGNKSFREALQYIIHISLVFGLLMQNNNMFRLLDRKTHVAQEYSDLNRMLKRVADIVTYEKIQNNISDFPF